MLRINWGICLLAFLVVLLPSCKKEEDLAGIGSEGAALKVGNNHSNKSRCLTDRQMQELYKVRGDYRQEVTQGRQEVMERLLNDHSRSADAAQLLTIPVHFIVVHNPGQGIGSGFNISDQRIQSQLNALNKDFLRKNADAANTPKVFPVASSQIRFCLASKDPNGAATNGITRYATSLNFDNNELKIKGATTWDPTAYLNIWIAPNIEGLGYAYLPTPQSLPARNEDGVVILTEAFGGPNSGAEAPFDLGRTLTHEVGHYLGLDHIWGGGCAEDDGINDTPNQREENYDCPRHPSPSCGNQGDMFMNYMDYTNDDCLNAYTVGQVAYMRQILQTSRASLVRPGRTTCPSGPGDPEMPTCSDGIKNGSETGVDCGGPDCKPCSTSTNSADVGVISARQINGTACGGTIDLRATVQNFGATAVNNLTIEVRNGGTLVSSLNWTGSLASGAKREMVIPSFGLPSGSHSLDLRTDRPNGATDANKGNDALAFQAKGSTGNAMKLVIQPDEYGSDISWVIRNAAGANVASGGGYQDGKTALITASFCLPDGCYRLIMKDAYGDGICCDYGKGWYELRDQGGKAVIASDGYYGYKETQGFCIDQLSFSKESRERDQKDLSRVTVRKVSNHAIKSSN
jgi:hypothetical protein